MNRGGEELLTACDLWLEGVALLEHGFVDRAAVLVKGTDILWAGPAHDAPAVAADRVIDHGDGIITPGFVDLHVHGGAGSDASDGTAEALEVIGRAHAVHGTVGLCPTVLTAAADVMLAAASEVRAAMGRLSTGPRVLGLHLEGPFLSPDRVGAQPAEHVRAPDLGLLDELIAAAGPALRIVTLAPELPGALALVERLVAAGVVVALGHSSASYDEARRAIAAGASLCTHTFNAMSGLHHREPGLIGAVLEDDTIVAEVIADGIHVSEPVLRILWRLKCNQRLALVTDCTAAMDAPPAEARLGVQPVEVRDGAVRLPDGTLAGSSLTMERAVACLAQRGRTPLRHAVESATTVPLRVLGVSDAGSIAPGKRADLVVLDPKMAVRETWVGGRRVHPAAAELIQEQV
jgi:N-acetylglucosamine-6-phosphate deacetylase